jgi:hypothetical protein
MAKTRTKVRRASNRKSITGVSISPDERVSLYAQARYLPREFKAKAALLLPFTTYFQDPFVARTDPDMAIDDSVMVPWEPGLADGPTSSRFAVVDYNGDTGKLETPAVWSENDQAYVGRNRKVLDKTQVDNLQFHQVSLWALVQCALSFFEDGNALGRPIPWAFEGNRLIVVPHAGYGENAFYDRESKSLQFYYFGSADQTVYTCLSVDIVNHELAHAILDGIRPLYNESIHPQTAAFHEFMGDVSAILLTLQNRTLRGRLAKASGGRFEKAGTLSSIAEEFGSAVSDRPYLRTALNKRTMAAMADETEPHDLSEVLTGAVFDVLIELGRSFRRVGGRRLKRTPAQAFWFAADRMQRMAIQPLDLLPPVDVTFSDYARAMCRSQRLADPLDPEDYYGILIKVFRKRGILSAAEESDLRVPRYLNERLALSVPHSLDRISRSRTGAYQFLDDNREDLLIPAAADFVIADLYDARKRGRQNLPLPRQIVLQYVWREEVLLEGARFGEFAGQVTDMLCGGTIVFNDDGNVVSWMMKPGSLPYAGRRERGGRIAGMWAAASAQGRARRREFLRHLAAEIAEGRVGPIAGSAKGMIGSLVPPVTADGDAERVRFRRTPHLHLSQDSQRERTGARQWQISS